MQRLIATAIAFGFCFSLSADEPAPRFPYPAFIAPATAPVRSGPGETFYPVLDLKRGDAVEVWRHDPDGWCAVRPPEGAFSWIAGDFLHTVDGRLGTVVGREVNVRVGTRFSDLRDVVQVRLNEGEQVTILESRTLLTGDRELPWFKIAPPAGEFRWVHERHLVKHPDQIPAEVAATTETTTAASVQQVGFLKASPAHEAALARLQTLPPDASTTAVLNELEAILSEMVTSEPTAWHFAELERQGEALVNRAETAVERSQARLFLGKLARFADIQKRYAAVAHIRTSTAEVDQQLKSTAPIATPKLPLDGSRDVSRYDGVGRLTQIVLREASAPNYALTDETGKVTAYIAAAPGVNLRQYVGLDVGVNGIRGFVVEQGMTQIIAKRVDILDARTAAARR